MASRLQVVKVFQDPITGWKSSEVLLNERLGEQVIRQQLLSPMGDRLLVVLNRCTRLYKIPNRVQISADSEPDA